MNETPTTDQPAPAGPEAPVDRLAEIVQRCGLCDDSVEQLDFHINRVHRLMTDRYHALVGGFAEAGRRAAEMEDERDALRDDLDEARAWSARWRSVATRYRAMLRVHRDRDIPEIARLTAEVAALKAALRTFAVLRWEDHWIKCQMCKGGRRLSEDERWASAPSPDVASIHEPSCLLAAAPDGAAR